MSVNKLMDGLVKTDTKLQVSILLHGSSVWMNINPQINYQSISIVKLEGGIILINSVSGY